MVAAADGLIDVGTREAWLAERRKGIGASEAAAALGLSPFATPLQLYLDKVGAAPPAEETEAMRWGTRLEPLLAEAFAEATGEAIAAPQVFRRSPDRPHLSATVDGLTRSGDLVELKTLSAFKAGSLGEEGTDELPDHWICQAMAQMYVFGRERVRFGVLVGGQRFRTFDVARNDALLESLLSGLDEFWGWVQRREPPPATAQDLAVLSTLRPSEGKAIALHAPEVLEAADEYAALGDAIRLREWARDGVKARLLEAMGDAAIATLPDGRVMSRKLVSRKGYTVEPKEYVQFGIKAPKNQEVRS